MAATPMSAGQGSDQEHQIVAVFETFDRARTARDRLAEGGIPAADMDIVHHAGDDDTAPPGQRDDAAWAFIRRFFVPAEERAAMPRDCGAATLGYWWSDRPPTPGTG